MPRVKLVNIESLPAGTPLETPLHKPKRRRVWNPPHAPASLPISPGRARQIKVEVKQEAQCKILKGILLGDGYTPTARRLFPPADVPSPLLNQQTVKCEDSSSVENSTGLRLFPPADDLPVIVLKNTEQTEECEDKSDSCESSILTALRLFPSSPELPAFAVEKQETPEECEDKSYESTSPAALPDLPLLVLDTPPQTEFENRSQSVEGSSPALPDLPVIVIQAPEKIEFVEYNTSGESTPNTTPTKPRAKRRRKQKDAKKVVDLKNYGSESDSEESCDDEDDMSMALTIPRVARIIMDTPEDADLSFTIENTPHATGGSGGLNNQPAWLSDPLYNFEWKPFPNPPIPPESRREKFSDANCGPTTPCVDPYEIFVSIWNRSFMKKIASETNKYAQQLAKQMVRENCLHPNSRICDWKDTNPDELYVYFGIMLAMGVVIKSRVVEYWSGNNDIFATPGFRGYMKLRRFQLLSKCIHFNDNSKMASLYLDPSEAKLYKIEPVITHLNERFQSMYNMRQNLALDESLLLWKGMLQINQFIPNKVAAVGIKSYELCESQTGYLWRFTIHAHNSNPKDSTKNPLNATTPALVLKLTKGLEHKGHTLWMDSYYNSPILARQLKKLGFDCVGTLRTNRHFIPNELRQLKKAEMAPGQIAGFTSGDVDIMVWRDLNRVATISTYHGNAVSTGVDGTPKPILIRDYNIMMGGVDKKDQLLSVYPVERKRTRVWYKKLFRRLINVSVLNAYIIHRHSNKSKPLTHRNFRVALVNSLLDHGARALVSFDIPSNSFDAGVHYPCEYPMLPSGNGRQRRRCAVCHKRTYAYCAGCKKSVCVFTCFKDLHKMSKT